MSMPTTTNSSHRHLLLLPLRASADDERTWYSEKRTFKHNTCYSYTSLATATVFLAPYFRSRNFATQIVSKGASFRRLLSPNVLCHSLEVVNVVERSYRTSSPTFHLITLKLSQVSCHVERPMNVSLHRNYFRLPTFWWLLSTKQPFLQSMSFSWSSSFSSKTSSSSFYSLLLSFQFELELSTHFWWKRRSSACQNVIFASTARRQPERLLVPVVALTHYSLLWTPTNQTTKLLLPLQQLLLNDEDGGRGGLWLPLQLLLL